MFTGIVLDIELTFFISWISSKWILNSKEFEKVIEDCQRRNLIHFACKLSSQCLCLTQNVVVTSQPMYAKKPWATPWKKCIVHFNWWCLQGTFSSMDYVLFCFIICWFVLETWYFWYLTLALLKFTEMFRFLAISILMSMFILLYWQRELEIFSKKQTRKIHFFSNKFYLILTLIWFSL